MQTPKWTLGCTLLAALVTPLEMTQAAPQPSSAIPSSLMQVRTNTCEARINPQGLDVLLPRLSWVTASATRGDGQSAYQILVASSPTLLHQNKGDLWNSGKQVSTSNSVAYRGRALASRQKCYWKVRVWNAKNVASAWGAPSQWSMGLLQDSDWKAQWITDPILANTANFPGTFINCYRSQTTARQDELKWLTLDLGKEQPVDSVNIQPARMTGQNHDFASLMYPLRFKIEVASNASFSDARTVVDKSGAD
ncbi:hypothetical protein EON80_13760, partial [bacterium]